LPVRPTVAAELNVRTRTVDRLLAKAKAEGWFDDQRKFTA
jgi:DNA-binding transcriptional regulator LsrR (DeoR family)